MGDFRDTPTGPGTLGLVPTGGFETGDLETLGDQDVFQTTLIQGLTYTIEQQGAATGDGTLVDRYLYLVDGGNTVIAFNDDTPADLNSLIEITPGQPILFLRADACCDAVPARIPSGFQKVSAALALTTSSALPWRTPSRRARGTTRSAAAMETIASRAKTATTSCLAATATTMSGAAGRGRDPWSGQQRQRCSADRTPIPSSAASTTTSSTSIWCRNRPRPSAMPSSPATAPRRSRVRGPRRQR